jgi:putative Mg2+ transporter-C (MgtC) family protein
MEEFWRGLAADWPAMPELLDSAFRLTLAGLLGALPGFQREQLNMPAGLRTHMLVAIGACLFVMAAIEASASIDATTRVIQGLATGIGFVGAGAILKSKDDNQVHGLTTAASVWLTAALGTAVGMGRIWLPIVGSVLAFIVLAALRPIEARMGDPDKQPGHGEPGAPLDKQKR